MIVFLFIAILAASSQAFSATENHHPIVNVEHYMFRYTEPRTLELAIDRPTKLTVRPWTETLSGEYQIVATLDSGKVLKSTMAKKPSLDIPDQPSGKVQLEIQSEENSMSLTFVTEKAPKEDELGPCYPEARDFFLNWYKKNELDWFETELFTLFRETTPGKSFLTNYGASYGMTFDSHILGSLKTKDTLAVQLQRDFHNYSDRYPERSILFFTPAGQLLNKVEGQVYFVDSEKNFYLSHSLRDHTATVEELVKVKSDGSKIWATTIWGTKPPLEFYESRSGNLAFIWNEPRHTGQYPDSIGTPAIDPKAGTQTTKDSIIQRSHELCGEKSDQASCQKSKDKAFEKMRTYWLDYIKENGFYERNGQACSHTLYFCYQIHLISWKETKDRFLIEVTITHRRDAGDGYENYLIFFDDNKWTKLPGLYYRTLDDGNILMTAGVDKTFETSLYDAWYDNQEELALVNPQGKVLWQKELYGRPAFFKGQGESRAKFSDGVLLKNDQFLWMTHHTNAHSVTSGRFDMKTGQEIKESVPRVGSGLCSK